MTHKLQVFGKKSAPTLFAPERNALKESLAKLEGFAALKAAVDALDAQLAARPATKCSKHHRVAFNSRNEVLQMC